MVAREDKSPRCGNTANHLGVRPGTDIRADEGGLVTPTTGGLSTTPDDPALLPPHVRPASLGGFGRLPLYVIESEQIRDGLRCAEIQTIL